MYVYIAGVDDKRQVTLVLANTPTGHLLPPQIVYTGKTQRCHPRFQFPEGWHVTHTPNHWSNEATTLEFINEVLDPYFIAQREALDLEPDHRALVLLDVFAAHRTQAVKDLFWKKNISIVYVPASCTGELQPLDVSGNGSFKQYLKDLFIDFYGKKVAEQREAGTNNVIDMKLSTLKPLHANWVVQAWSKLKTKPELSIIGWRKTGLLEAVEGVAEVEEE